MVESALSTPEIVVQACRGYINLFSKRATGHFIGVCLVTWPMNAREAEVDHALIQTSLLFSRQRKNNLDLHNKNSEVFIKTRSPAVLLAAIPRQFI